VAGRQYTLPTGLTAALDVRLFEPSADASRESELIRLMGYRLNEERVKRGEKLQITLYWRAGRETDRNYSVFAHLEGERVWSQHDSWPMEGLKPTSTWAREEVVADRHVIPLGQDIPPGTYRLVVGMYDSATFEPLTALNSGGQVIPEGRVVLQTIELYVP
jgi:hypothetical protein